MPHELMPLLEVSDPAVPASSSEQPGYATAYKLTAAISPKPSRLLAQ